MSFDQALEDFTKLIEAILQKDFSFQIPNFDNHFVFSDLAKEIKGIIEAINLQKQELKDRDAQLDKLLKFSILGNVSTRLVQGLKRPMRLAELNYQKLYSALYQEKLLDEGIRSHLQDIQDNLQRIDTVANLSNKFVKKRQFFHKIQLIGVIENALSCTKHTLEALDVNLVKDYQCASSQIFGNKDLLLQVFVNLVTNACHAMQGLKKRQVLFRLQKRGNLFEVNVLDSGRGISEKDRKKIFDPFYTKRKDGTGLGLSISQEIIEEHGGQLFCERAACFEKNYGACLTLLFPIVQ